MVEWDEPEKPCDVVEKKNVEGYDSGRVSIGDMCRVGFRKGVKVSFYDAKLLGVGMPEVLNRYLCVCLIEFCFQVQSRRWN